MLITCLPSISSAALSYRVLLTCDRFVIIPLMQLFVAGVFMAFTSVNSQPDEHSSSLSEKKYHDKTDNLLVAASVLLLTELDQDISKTKGWLQSQRRWCGSRLPAPEQESGSLSSYNWDQNSLLCKLPRIPWCLRRRGDLILFLQQKRLCKEFFSLQQ